MFLSVYPPFTSMMVPNMVVLSSHVPELAILSLSVSHTKPMHEANRREQMCIVFEMKEDGDPALASTRRHDTHEGGCCCGLCWAELLDSSLPTALTRLPDPRGMSGAGLQ